MPQTKLMAILSLVFGSLSLVCSVIPYVGLVAILFVIPSIVLGIIALIKAIKNHTAGKGFAIAGLACSAVASSFGLVIQVIVIPNFMKYRSESQAAACISNMAQIQTAAETWRMHYWDKTPTMSDLCGKDKYLKDEPKCPKDGSPYRLRINDGTIEVECRSGDPTHVMSDYRW